MGAKSTLNISRETAMLYINKRLLTATDQELADMMETLYGDRLLYNYRIDSYNEEELPRSHDNLANVKH